MAMISGQAVRELDFKERKRDALAVWIGGPCDEPHIRLRHTVILKHHKSSSYTHAVHESIWAILPADFDHGTSMGCSVEFGDDQWAVRSQCDPRVPEPMVRHFIQFRERHVARDDDFTIVTSGIPTQKLGRRRENRRGWRLVGLLARGHGKRNAMAFGAPISEIDSAQSQQ
jgi:hypothetical protein